jgi:DNA replication protein DnaC
LAEPRGAVGAWSDPFLDDWRTGYEVVRSGGYAMAFVRERLVCPRCHGTGRVEVSAPDQPLRVGRCRCQKVVDACALWNAAEVPARHAHCTLDSFKAELPGASPGYTIARSWLARYDPKTEGKGLVLEGEPGRGKTHLLCGILRELVFKHGVAVRFVEFTHLLSTMKESFDKRGGDPVRLTSLARTPVLAIDELGKGRKTDWEIAIIDEIVSRAYNHGSMLLGTTNFAPRTVAGRATGPVAPAPGSLARSDAESLQDRLGDRVFSRLREMVTFASVRGDDFRESRTLR